MKVIDLTPDWEGIAPAIIYGLKHTEDKDKTWEDSVMQMSRISDEFNKLLKEGKITQDMISKKLRKEK